MQLSGDGNTARLDLSLVREDGTVPFTKRFEQQMPPATPGRPSLPNKNS